MAEIEKTWAVLRVEGTRYFKGRPEQFCAGAIFENDGDNWRILSCAPLLWTVLKGAPIERLGEHLTKLGYKWEWV